GPGGCAGGQAGSASATGAGALARRGALRVALSEPTGAPRDEPVTPIVYVCITCRRAGEPDAEPRPGALLADATARAAHDSGVTVRRVRCLANCTRGPSAAGRANGSWASVFRRPAPGLPTGPNE